MVGPCLKEEKPSWVLPSWPHGIATTFQRPHLPIQISLSSGWGVSFQQLNIWSTCLNHKRAWSALTQATVNPWRLWLISWYDWFIPKTLDPLSHCLPSASPRTRYLQQPRGNHHAFSKESSRSHTHTHTRFYGFMWNLGSTDKRLYISTSNKYTSALRSLSRVFSSQAVIGYLMEPLGNHCLYFGLCSFCTTNGLFFSYFSWFLALTLGHLRRLSIGLYQSHLALVNVKCL